MKSKIYLYTKDWNTPLDGSLDSTDTLVTVFFDSDLQKVDSCLEEIKEKFPLSTIIGASSSGEIFQDEVYEDSISVSIIKFEKTKLKHFVKENLTPENSYDTGLSLAKTLYSDDLAGVFILSEGLTLNGSYLTEAISSIIPSSIPVTGGLAGDKANFVNTWVIANGSICENAICAIGFYGENLHYEHAFKGGLDSLGLKRVITKSKENVVYEIDNKPALEIYKRYLGEKAAELPISGLFFPLEVRQEGSGESKIRTLLAIDEEQNSITFAGNVPEDSVVTLMKANTNRLINGAEEAAETLNLSDYDGNGDIVCLAVSCVGRRLVLKSRTEEELEAVLDVLPSQTKQIGFYSYGEISPLKSGKCDLHNQTMTLTLLWESDA